MEPDDDSLNCPLCGYDLRGLPTNRCPECGHAFDPDELRRAKAERRDWLFEHAPPRRRARSFLATTLASLAPWLFWRRVEPAHVIVPGRLRAWAFVWLAIPVLAIALAFGSTAFGVYREAHAAPAFGMVPVNWASVRGPNGTRYWRPTSMPGAAVGRTNYAAWGLANFTWRDAVTETWRRAGGAPLAAFAAALAWPVVAVAVLQLFGATLRTAGICTAHLWRCALYALPSVLLPTLAGVAAIVGFSWTVGDFSYEFGTLLNVYGLSSTTVVVLLVAVTLSTTHLVLAHVLYLRLRHAVAQALLVQIVTWLATWAAIYLTLGE